MIEFIQRELTQDEISEFEDMRKKFIVPHPPYDLREIYETNRLVDLIGMRADKYDSPEHKRALDRLRTKFEENPENSDKEFKVPRMIQNPNFDEILRFLKEIRTQKRKQDLTNLANFINELPLPLVEEYKQPTTIIYDYENLNANKDKLDPRFCFSLTDFLTYLNNFWIEK